MKFTESTKRESDPLVNLAGYGHTGGKLAAAAAVLENTATTTAIMTALHMLDSI